MAAVQAFVLPCLSRRAKCACQVNASNPHVRNVLDPVIWRFDTRRDFIPIGSEQPGGQAREDGVKEAGSGHVRMRLRSGDILIPAFTVQFAAHQLHAQRARLPTHQWNDPEELGDERRVEQVGLGSIVVGVPNKHLQRRGRSQQSTWMRAAWPAWRLLTWSRVSPSVRYTVNVLPSRLDATLKALMNSALPMRLAPCVTIPVRRIFLCMFTCCHGNTGDKSKNNHWHLNIQNNQRSPNRICGNRFFICACFITSCVM